MLLNRHRPELGADGLHSIRRQQRIFDTTEQATAALVSCGTGFSRATLCSRTWARWPEATTLLRETEARRAQAVLVGGSVGRLAHARAGLDAGNGGAHGHAL